MADPVMTQRYLDALQARITNGSVFTAYDVTTDVRDSTDENVRHLEVRDVVHQEFNSGQFPMGWRSEFTPLNTANGGTVDAVVFFPDTKINTDHPKAVQPTTAVPTPQYTPPSMGTAPKPKGGSTKDGDGFLCKKTIEGRINIPGDVLDQVQRTGSSFDIRISGRVVFKAPNEDGRVRVSSTDLAMAGDGDTYRVKAEPANNTVVIELA